MSDRKFLAAFLLSCLCLPAHAQSVNNRGVFGSAPNSPNANLGNSATFGTSPGTPGSQNTNVGTFGSSQLGVITTVPSTSSGVPSSFTPVPLPPVSIPTAPSFTAPGGVGSPITGVTPAPVPAIPLTVPGPATQ